jgi:hypothetical protein
VLAAIAGGGFIGTLGRYELVWRAIAPLLVERSA